ncbi:MAG: WG repeat-containing protein, partial [Brevinematales bacterium]|nr:WG repeat-containing protein [Brevinematales bacterium]
MKKDLFILFFILFVCIPLSAESVLYPVNISGKWGFINTSGKLSVPAAYDTVRKFHDNIAAVGKANSKGFLRYGYIDTAGKSVLKPVYLSVSDFSCGIGVIVKDDVKKSVFCVNNQGVSIHSFPLLSATAFTNGLSIIRFYDETNNRICDGILSNNGTILTNRFEKLIGVSDGLILIQAKIPVIGPDNMITSYLEKKGFVDMSGEVL